VLELWGMAETTGSAMANTSGVAEAATVGHLLPGVEVGIAKDGGIFVLRPIVFLGCLPADGSVRDGTDAEG
jgi:long-subunit acyl-CoA synthetase (AMP-forming)